MPQQDIQHPQLKVQQALDYAAKLRLPPDTTAAERTARVKTVADQLQLTARLDNRIGTQLSGGQRKRVSVATELLTAPIGKWLLVGAAALWLLGPGWLAMARFRRADL